MSFTDLKIKDEDFKGRNIQSIESDTVIGTAEELKRLFDAPAQEVMKEAVNALIDYLMTAEAGGEIGTPELNEQSGNTIAEQFRYLMEQIKDATAGTLADGSVEDIKLSDASDQIKSAVEKLKGVLKRLEADAPHNALVRWNATLSEDDAEELCFDYVRTKNGACYSDEDNGDLKFGTLPMSYGGTNNKNLENAPDGVLIAKKTYTSGKGYLGYLNNVPVANGGTGASTAVAARANLGAAAADHTHDSKTVSAVFNENILNKHSSTMRYSPVTKTCFARIYCETKAVLNEGDSYEICRVPSEYTPGSRFALSNDGLKKASAYIGSDSCLYIRPYENIPASNDIYVSGFWFA